MRIQRLFHSLAPAAILALLAAPAAQAVAEEPPRVVVSFTPIHSLAAAIMEGVGEPELLVPPNGSPHEFSLRPSQAQAMQEADLIIRVGPALERFMDKPIATLGANAHVLDLMEAEGVTHLALREPGALGEEEDHHHHPGSEDPHVWLDPANAKAMVRAIAGELSEMDPDHAGQYAKNEQGLLASLDTLDGDVRSILGPVRDRPLIAFHDALQYFEKAFGMRVAGTLSISPDIAPGAKRLSALRDVMEEQNVRCILVEPQFSPRLAQTIADETGARVATFDPAGSAVEPGPDAYRETMLTNTRALAECLVDKR